MMTTYPTVERLFEATKIDEAIDWLRQHAGPLIKEVGDPLKYRLLRGSARYVETFSEVRVRQDRQSKMLGSSRTAFVNDLIQKKGLHANRSNSVFTQGDYEAAADWQPAHDGGAGQGVPYVVIPKGPFDYTWMPAVDDLNMWIMYNDHLFLDDKNYGDAKHMANVDAAIAKLEIRGNDHTLQTAITSKNKCEIMIHPHSNTIGLFNYDVFSVAMGMLQDS